MFSKIKVWQILLFSHVLVFVLGGVIFLYLFQRKTETQYVDVPVMIPDARYIAKLDSIGLRQKILADNYRKLYRIISNYGKDTTTITPETPFGEIPVDSIWFSEMIYAYANQQEIPISIDIGIVKRGDLLHHEIKTNPSRFDIQVPVEALKPSRFSGEAYAGAFFKYPYQYDHAELGAGCYVNHIGVKGRAEVYTDNDIKVKWVYGVVVKLF